jgi:hypothetical protein
LRFNMRDSLGSCTEVRPRRPARRRGPVVVIVGLLLLSAAAGYAIFVANQRRVASEQIERFRTLARTLETLATERDGELPVQMPPVVGPASLDAGEPWVVYRPVTLSGEAIRFEPAGNRIIAWSPQPGLRGRRAIVLNDMSVQLVTEDAIDLKSQRFLAGEALNRSHATLRSAGAAPRRRPVPDDDDIPTTQSR